jgi:hypothetical protein
MERLFEILHNGRISCIFPLFVEQHNRIVIEQKREDAADHDGNGNADKQNCKGNSAFAGPPAGSDDGKDENEKADGSERDHHRQEIRICLQNFRSPEGHNANSGNSEDEKQTEATDEQNGQFATATDFHEICLRSLSRHFQILSCIDLAMPFKSRRFEPDHLTVLFECRGQIETAQNLKMPRE